MTRQLTQAVTDAALQLGEAATNSMVTISHRMPILLGHIARPSAAGLAEWNAAATEKVAAGFDGAVAAWSAWHAMMVEAMFAPFNPLGMAQGAMEVARVASHPAHACVRANAARLSER